jgi:hypothetical protein
LQHRFALTDFASEEVGEAVPEEARYYESNTVVREPRRRAITSLTQSCASKSRICTLLDPTGLLIRSTAGRL